MLWEAGNKRYEVVRTLGRGGMGVVYEAFDREREQRVALKTIDNPGVEELYRLKREFRVLADMGHPNLVTLYDLVVDDSKCFFTMELLEGQDLLAYWNPGHARDLEPDTQTRDLGIGTDAGYSANGSRPGMAAAELPSCSCELERIRQSLPQLARGLYALHLAGKIHRDVKPSNVRVTADGRVVLLDFGLASELVPRGEYRSDPGVVGTVQYMAPEQCAGLTDLTPATDWYGVGTMLFEALAGGLPFQGPMLRIVMDKQKLEPPRVADRVTGAPEDLAALCEQMLARDPDDRLGGRELMRRVGADADDTGVLHVPRLASDTEFAGRDDELDTLGDAFACAVGGRASVAVVHGASGMGKSALINRALSLAAVARPDALMLEGRCLDREDVPYKAIDGLIDELSNWWRDLAFDEAKALLPEGAPFLVRLFPVLERVPAVAVAPAAADIADPQLVRTRAFDALRETLRAIGRDRPLVLYIDDMQWVDRDTSVLLGDLLRAPDPPPVLLVMSTRPEGADRVADIVERMDARRFDIELGPLPDDVAAELAASQLSGPAGEELAGLVKEAGGSPFFLIELARYMQGHRSVESVAGLGLEELLAARFEELGPSARRLGEIVALAGEPLPPTVLGRAAGLSTDSAARHLSMLSLQRVVRSRGGTDDALVEPYHDRVRESLAARIEPEERVKVHEQLALALERLDGTAEQLTRHWHAAGESDRAAMHARTAGDEACGRLDFDLAARLYGLALEGTQWTEDARREIRTLRGDALADAGLPREAADEFIAATDGADADTALELERRAAGVLLQSGYIAEGLELTEKVLHGVGLSMPSSAGAAMRALVFRRTWLRLRGLGFSPRAAEDIDQSKLTRVDVCEGVSFGLALVDPLQSMDFAARFLQEALAVGEPWRVSRALALEADLRGAMSSPSALRLLTRLEELTKTIDTPAAEAQLLTTRGFIDFFLRNDVKAAYETMTEATARYQASVGRAGYEIDTVRIFYLWALSYMGNLRDLAREVSALAEQAARTGNLYMSVMMRCGYAVGWLSRQDSLEYDQMVVDTLQSWPAPEGAYQFQHLVALVSRVEAAIYRGEPDVARQLLDHDWKPMRRSMIDRPFLQTLLIRLTVARCELALAVEAPAGSARRRKHLSAVKKAARIIGRRPVPLMHHVELMLRGAVDALDGKPERAIESFRATIEAMDARHIYLFSAAAKEHLGELVGGDEGAALRVEARATLGEGVRDPKRMLFMLLPHEQGPR